MFAFAPSAPISSVKPRVGATSFATPLAARPLRPSNAPTMVLRVSLRKLTQRPISTFGGAGVILQKADDYMSQSVLNQYLAIANPSGEYGVQCTEGSVKGAADAQRVRVLSSRFRSLQASPYSKYLSLYENRKNAIAASHECHHEEEQFCGYRKVSSTYNLAREEATGACIRYATPETVEEAAMVRYMDIQQNNAANPTGVYTTACMEGSYRGAAEDMRVAALNTAFRNGQKPTGQILQEKYEQKKKGYAACHGCTYEEGLVSLYPAIGASFRPKQYGY